MYLLYFCCKNLFFFGYIRVLIDHPPWKASGPKAWFTCADQNIKNLVMHSVLSFMVLVDVRYVINALYMFFLLINIFIHVSMIFFFFVSPQTNLLHQELLNFMLITMSTQLLSGPSPGPKDVHPFIDAAMAEVRRWSFDFMCYNP